MVKGGEKVRENRLRRMAERQGLALVKSRVRDPRALAIAHGKWSIRVADPAAPKAAKTGMTLADVEAYLTGDPR